jgi:hypothetical protein
MAKKLDYEKDSQNRKPKEFREDGWAPFVSSFNDPKPPKKPDENSAKNIGQPDLFQNQVESNIYEIATQTLNGNYHPLIRELALITQERISIESRNSYESLKSIFEEKLKNSERSDYFLSDNKNKAERMISEYKEVITYLSKLEIIIKSI